MARLLELCACPQAWQLVTKVVVKWPLPLVLVPMARVEASPCTLVRAKPAAELWTSHRPTVLRALPGRCILPLAMQKGTLEMFKLSPGNHMAAPVET
jgi:hypothetical protein